MAISIDKLLEPLSEENPCGEDIGYDPQFLELETMLIGKEETQFAAAEEPDWKSIIARCLELFERSKDLRVAIRLTLGLLRTNGLQGFRDGLHLLNGMLDQYWDPMYPRLDPDDNNDPLERVNVFASLATPAGTFGDPMQFLKRLRLAPLADSPVVGKVSMADIDRASAGAQDDGSGFTSSQINAAFKSTPPDRLQVTCQAAADCYGLVVDLEARLTRAVGARNAITFEPLSKALKEIQKVLAPYAGESLNEQPSAAEQGHTASGATEERFTSGEGSVGGALRNRQDVIRLLEQICEYYKQTEPSSPVPLLLQRARRLVDMNFMQLLEDLTPEAINQLRVITGLNNESHSESHSESSAEE